MVSRFRPATGAIVDFFLGIQCLEQNSASDRAGFRFWGSRIFNTGLRTTSRRCDLRPEPAATPRKCCEILLSSGGENRRLDRRGVETKVANGRSDRAVMHGRRGSDQIVLQGAVDLVAKRFS
jgi:hypothetical protein